MWTSKTLSVWGKSGPPPLPLVEHLSDTEAVACTLWDHFISSHTKRYLANELRVTEEQARSALVFLASVHDVGKATPVFQSKVKDLASIVRSYGLGCEEVSTEALKQRSHHALTGQVILERWLTAHDGDARWGDAVGAHHGAGQYKNVLYGAPRQRPYSAYEQELLGGEGWRDVQDEILEHFWNTYGEEALPVLRTTPSSSVLMLVTGVIIYADWLASNEDLFSEAGESSLSRQEQGVQRLRLPATWTPVDTPDFEDRFGCSPYESQRKIAELMAGKEEEGLWIIESSMGTGKTESALLGAEILASKFGLHGAVFALPNRASANSVFTRFVDWMDSLPGETLTASAPVYLAHGKAQLNQAYTSLAERETDSDGDATSRQRVANFFQNPKTYPLTPMMVSTVDHVIMAGLDSKHQMLRHLAFSGKVIIIDEVHAYDAFMSTFLDHALEAFGAYRVPVILLSATLPPARRQALVEAYSRRTEAKDVQRDIGYPLVTYASHDGNVETHAFASPKPSITYQVEHCENSLDDVMTAVRKTTSQGGNVLIIRNTVKRAMDTHDALVSDGLDSLLFHSRFLPADRELIENDLIKRFSSRVVDRECGKVVVATQVAEQSLDLDFDHLVTDLAPVDLVFQRLGRVFRNFNAPRNVEAPLVTIIDLPLQQGKFVALPYAEWMMHQSAEVLGAVTSLAIPSDVPKIVRTGYGEDRHPDLKKRFITEEEKAQRIANINALSLADRQGLLGTGHNSPDENKVRDIKDQEEVLALEMVDGTLRIPSWFPADLHPGAQADVWKPGLYKALHGTALSIRSSLIQRAEVTTMRIPAFAKDRDTIVLILRKNKEEWTSNALSYSPTRGLM